MKPAGRWAVALIAAALWHAPISRSAHAQNFVEGKHYWLEPAAYPEAGHQRGADGAKGAVIWNDGYSPERTASETMPPIVQYFAEAGWDAFNLGRHSSIQTQHITQLILLGIEKLKAKGYRRIILIGHSAGAFASIEAGAYRADVTGILPLAPANYGDYGRGRSWRQNDFAIRALWDSFNGSKLRVAAGFFTDDDWYEAKEPHVRGPYASRRLTELGVANFIIDQPAYRGMTTHFGGVGAEFARRYGPCLEYFFDTGNTPPCDDGDPGAAALFGIAPPPVPETDRSGFAGQWQGTIATGRFVVLTIPPPSGNRSSAVYQTGLGLGEDKPETARWILTRRDGMLVREEKFEFRLRIEDSNSLKITYADYAGTGAEKDFAVLRRVAAR